MVAFEPVGSIRRYPELERLICAAVCNERLAARLIAEPAEVLSTARVAYRLTPDERAVVLSIRGAQSIQEFAAMLHAKLNGHAERYEHRYEPS